MTDKFKNISGQQENQTGSEEKHPEKDEHFLISPVIAGFAGLIGCFFLYQIAGGLLTVLVFGFDLESAPIQGLRLMTVGGQILFILLPALLLAKLFYIDAGRVIKIRIPDWREILLFVLGLIILIPLLQSYMYIQNYFIDIVSNQSEFIRNLKSLLDSFNELIEKTYGNLLRKDSFLEGIFVIFVIAVVPAVSEETLFRGFVQKSFEFKWKPFTAIFITAVFFAGYHFNPYGLIALITLGMFFGMASYLSNSLIIPFILHFLNNLTAVTVYFISGDDELISSDAVDPANLPEQLLSFFFLLLLFLSILFLIKKYYSRIKLT